MKLLRMSWSASYPAALRGLLLAWPALAAGQTLPHQAGKIPTAQVALAYETFGASGSALPLLVVNGGPGLSHAYLLPTDVWKQLAQKRRVIFYDQRGTGASKPVQAGAPQTLAVQVADLEAVRKGLNLPQVLLLGDSYGGLLSIAYASAYPEHVAKLILSDAAGSNLNTLVHLFEEVFPETMATEKQQKQPPVVTQEMAEASMRTHFNLLFYSQAQRDLYFKKLGPIRNVGLEPAVGQAVGADASKADFTPKLAGFTFPTLVLTGRYDMNVAPLTAWRLQQAIPGAKIVFFEQSGHFPWFEEPVKYRTVMEQFLDSPR